MIRTNCSYDYDQSPHQFNPSGRVIQIERAFKASNKGSPIIASKCKNGVVLITASKKLSNLVVKSPEKVYSVDTHVNLAFSGLLFDAQAIANLASIACVLLFSFFISSFT
jgi:20S proteasome alpha/beta subunit